MREAIRSRLRTTLLVWTAASMALFVGCCAGVAIFAFGLYEGVQSFSSASPSLDSIGPMVLGCGLELFFAFLLLSVRDRFERRCWQIVAADAGPWVDKGTSMQILNRQADGEDNYVADVRARQSRHLAKRLRTLIYEAWPDRSNR